MRFIPDADYDLILQAGFTRALAQISTERSIDAAGFAEEQLSFDRPIVERMISRPFREAAFAAKVREVYANTCAMTGLKIINGGGGAEVQAAHIRPVFDQGPDSIRNGLALSGTVHWMFDRGLVSIGDDYSILVAKGRLPDAVTRLLLDERLLLLPSRADRRPHPFFLRYHRHEVFKG